MGHYRIFPHVNEPQEFHNLLGVLILMGSMILVIGILLFDMMLMTIGSGMVAMSAFLSVCFLDNQRGHQNFSP